MSKPMTHLEAFTSEDGKRGREWFSVNAKYRRAGSVLQRCVPGGSCTPGGDWKDHPVQVAAMEGSVTWSDEPKTLTPQEALRALADGKCVGNGHVTLRADMSGDIMRYATDGSWRVSKHQGLCGLSIVPDPSQLAEQRRDWNPLGPYEDMPADIQRDIETERGFAKAEPQVEYLLSFAEAYVAMHRDLHFVCHSENANLMFRFNDEGHRFETAYVNEGRWSEVNIGRASHIPRWRIVTDEECK